MPGPGQLELVCVGDLLGCGSCPHAANNRAELAAMYKLFAATAETNPPLHILCDSKGVIGATNGNRANVNADLIDKLRAAMVDRDLTLEWLKGHKGHPLNEGADEKCTAASAAVGASQIIPTGPGWTITDAVRDPAPTLNIQTMDLPF